MEHSTMWYVEMLFGICCSFPDAVPELWRRWNPMGQSQTVAYRRTLYPWCILVLYVVFHQEVIRRIWVR